MTTRTLVAICAAATLVVSACTPDESAPTSTPTPGTATPTPEPTSTPTALPVEDVAERAAELLVRAFDNIYNDRDAAPATVRDVTVPGSQARDWLLERVAIFDAFETASGDLLAEVIVASQDGSTTTARLCVSSVTDTSPGADGWATYTVTVTDPASPRLRRVIINEDDSGGSKPCVPPEISDTFFADYPQWRDAKMRYFANPQNPAAQSEVARWLVTGDTGLSGLRDRAYLEGTLVDPVIESAGRNMLTMSQCQDPELNENARVETPDGQTLPLQPTATRYRFELVDGRWLQGEFTNHGPDSRDPSPWQRCFGDEG